MVYVPFYEVSDEEVAAAMACPDCIKTEFGTQVSISVCDRHKLPAPHLTNGGTK
jgi:hypothetical protein